MAESDLELLRLRAKAKAKAESEASVSDEEGTEEEPQPETSPIRAAILGVGESVPVIGSYLDEIEALARTNPVALDPLRGQAVEADPASYDRELLKTRLLNQQTREENPGPYYGSMAGGLLGQVLAPWGGSQAASKLPWLVRAAKAGIVGSAVGALENAPNMEERGKNALIGLAGGAGGQALADLPRVWGAGKRAARNAFDALRAETKLTGKLASREADIAAKGMSELGEKLGTDPEAGVDIGRRMLDEGILSGIPFKKKISERLAKAKDEAGREIVSVIDDLDERVRQAGRAGIDKNEMNAAVRAELQLNPHMQGARAQNKVLERAEREFLESGSELSPKKAWELSSEIDGKVKWNRTSADPNMPLKEEIDRLRREYIRKRLSSLAGEVGGESAQIDLEKVMKRYHELADASKAATSSRAKSLASNAATAGVVLLPAIIGQMAKDQGFERGADLGLLGSMALGGGAVYRRGAPQIKARAWESLSKMGSKPLKTGVNVPTWLLMQQRASKRNDETTEEEEP